MAYMDNQQMAHMRGPTYFNSELLHGGMQGMGGDMYGASPNSGYGPHGVRPPVHSQAMLIPGHPHHMMMAAHSGHMGHMGAGLPGAQSPPLHAAMDAGMGHIQDIHAG